MSCEDSAPRFSYRKKETSNKNRTRVNERQKIEFAKFLMERIPFAISFNGDEERKELQKILKRHGPDRSIGAWISSWHTYTDDIEKRISEGAKPEDLSEAKQEIYKVMVACQKHYEEEERLRAAELPEHSKRPKMIGQGSKISKVRKSQRVESDIEISGDSEMDSADIDDSVPSDSDEMIEEDDSSSKKQADKRYKPLSTVEKHRQTALLGMQQKSLKALDNDMGPNASDPLVAGLSSIVKKGKSSSIQQIDTEFEELNEKIKNLQLQFDELSKVADEDIPAIKNTIGLIKKILDNIPNLVKESVRVKLRELLANLQMDAATNSFLIPVPEVDDKS